MPSGDSSCMLDGRFLEAGPVGTSCLARTEMPDPRRGGRTRHRVGTGSHSQQLGSGTNPQKSRFPDCSPGPALHAGLPDDSSLRPAVVTFHAHSSGAGECSSQLMTRSGQGRCLTPQTAQTAPQLRLFQPRTLAVSGGLRRPPCPAVIDLFANCPRILLSGFVLPRFKPHWPSLSQPPGAGLLLARLSCFLRPLRPLLALGSSHFCRKEGGREPRGFLFLGVQ